MPIIWESNSSSLSSQEFEKSFLERPREALSLVGHKISVPLLGNLEIINHESLTAENEVVQYEAKSLPTRHLVSTVSAHHFEGLRGKWYVRWEKSGYESWVNFGVLRRTGTNHIYLYIHELSAQACKFDGQKYTEWRTVSTSDQYAPVNILLPVKRIWSTITAESTAWSYIFALPTFFMTSTTTIVDADDKTFQSLESVPISTAAYALLRWNTSPVSLHGNYFTRYRHEEIETQVFISHYNESIHDPSRLSGWQILVEVFGIFIVTDAVYNDDKTVSVLIHSRDGKEHWGEICKGPSGFYIVFTNVGIFKVMFLRKPEISPWFNSMLVIPREFFVCRFVKRHVHEPVNIHAEFAARPENLLGYQMDIRMFGIFIVTAMRRATSAHGVMLDFSEHSFQNHSGVAIWGRLCEKRGLGFAVYVRRVGYLLAQPIEKVTDIYRPSVDKSVMSTASIETAGFVVRMSSTGHGIHGLVKINGKPVGPHIAHPGTGALVFDPCPPPPVQELECVWAPAGIPVPPEYFERDHHAEVHVSEASKLVHERALEHPEELIGYQIDIAILGTFVVTAAKPGHLRLQNPVGGEAWGELVDIAVTTTQSETFIKLGRNSGALCFTALKQLF